MELRLPINAFRARTVVREPRKATSRLSVGDRIGSWLFSWRLDEKIANGADPSRDPLLARRAEQIASGRFRHRLAQDLRGVIASSERFGRLNGPPATARSNVREQRARLERLAERLDDGLPVGLSGVAAANLLLTDAGSPLWVGGRPETLGERLDAALIGLGR